MKIKTIGVHTFACLVTVLFLSLAVPFLSHAQDPLDNEKDSMSYTLKNPLNGFESIEDFFVAILNIIIVLATPIVVVFIIFAGFKYVTAQGKPEAIKDATRALTYAIIGGVILIGAVAIAEIIKNLVKSF